MKKPVVPKKKALPAGMWVKYLETFKLHHEIGNQTVNNAHLLACNVSKLPTTFKIEEYQVILDGQDPLQYGLERVF